MPKLQTSLAVEKWRYRIAYLRLEREFRIMNMLIKLFNQATKFLYTEKKSLSPKILLPRWESSGWECEHLQSQSRFHCLPGPPSGATHVSLGCKRNQQ